MAPFTLGKVHCDAGGRSFDLLKKAVMVPASVDGFRRIDYHNGKINGTVPNLQILITKLHLFPFAQAVFCFAVAFRFELGAFSSA